MKNIIAGICLMTISLPISIYAMPNELGYLCVSVSKKIVIGLSNASYNNNLGLISLRINKKPLKGIKLSAGYDGLPTQGRILAFQLSSYDAKNPIGIAVETQKIQSKAGVFSTSGIVKVIEQDIYGPDIPQVRSIEAMTCTLTDRSQIPQ